MDDRSCRRFDLSAEPFLGRIARHGVGFAVDPHEDRLTEVCAAVFASGYCEGLHAMSQLTGLPPL